MQTRSILWTFTVTLMLTGCATRLYSAEPSFRTLSKGAFSGVTEEKKEVIKSAADWEKFWKNHSSNASPAEKRPKIDFNKEMVIAITMGRQRTGGFDIEIIDVSRTDARLEIAYARTIPAPNAISIQALTAPFHFVAVSRTELKPVFKEVPPKKKSASQ